MTEPTLTQEERRELSRITKSFEVSPLEKEILIRLRSITHGKFTVQILDGLPIRYEIVTSRLLEGK